MTRPHEDLERHTLVDHRAGGVPITFAPGAWCGIDVVHMKAERVGAGIAAYETLIEKARAAALGVRVAAVLRSVNDRRVIALIEVENHEAFRHLQTSWDDHHLVAERRDVAESSTLALYRLAAGVGDTSIDPASKDAYAFEHVSRGTSALETSAPKAQGFRGLLVFRSDGGDQSAIIYRFGHAADIDAFRGIRADGDPTSAVHPVRTFG